MWWVVGSAENKASSAPFELGLGLNVQKLTNLIYPCFDVRDLTSDKLHEKSIIKQCIWKGERINCSQVFKMTPTDNGMCCKFDLIQPQNFFKDNVFTSSMETLQDQDATFAFDRNSSSFGRLLNIDVKPEVGRYMGLTLILDAHSDQISDGSIEDDSNRFLVGLTKAEEFPLMGQGTKVVRPGYEHFLSLTAVDTISEQGIKSLKPEKRKCLFPDEKPLKLHTNYSQSACLFECALSWAITSSKLSCSPWYFPPLTDQLPPICDPWDTQVFMAALRRAPRSGCQHCLPDCQATSFSLSASSAPFRPCTSLNTGLSSLCSYSSIVSPSMASQQVLQQYSHLDQIPQYLHRFRGADSATRVLSSGSSYDAYEDDIAILHVYWDKESIIQFQRALRLTWIDYISQVRDYVTRGVCKTSLMKS